MAGQASIPAPSDKEGAQAESGIMQRGPKGRARIELGGFYALAIWQ